MPSTLIVFVQLVSLVLGGAFIETDVSGIDIPFIRLIVVLFAYILATYVLVKMSIFIADKTRLEMYHASDNEFSDVLFEGEKRLKTAILLERLGPLFGVLFWVFNPSSSPTNELKATIRIMHQRLEFERLVDELVHRNYQGKGRKQRILECLNMISQLESVSYTSLELLSLRIKDYLLEQVAALTRSLGEKELEARALLQAIDAFSGDQTAPETIVHLFEQSNHEARSLRERVLRIYGYLKEAEAQEEKIKAAKRTKRTTIVSLDEVLLFLEDAIAETSP